MNPYRWWWRTGVALAAAMVVAAALLAGAWRPLAGSAAGSVTGSVADRDPPRCPQGETIAILHSPHVSQARAATVRYNSVPPTSGPHFAFTVAPGVYRSPVPDGLTVHALEHGHVAVQYATGTPAATVRQLEGLVRDYAGGVVLAPYLALPRGVALTSWGCLRILEQYDEWAVRDFIERNRGRYDHGWRSGGR